MPVAPPVTRATFLDATLGLLYDGIEHVMRNVILALCAAGAFSAAAHAQQWPARPVRVIVNVAPGGVADVTMRVLGARLTETMGQAFIVENRAGGEDRKSTRLNSSHSQISYAVFCLKKTNSRRHARRLDW